MTLSAGPKFVCYIKQNCNMIDEDQPSELIYTKKFQKAGMSNFDDAKSYVKNSSVNLVIIYIHMNILKMNFWIFLH